MTLDVELVQLSQLLALELSAGDAFSVDFGSIQGAAEPYTGSYEVTPSDASTILPTARKQMAKDVTVHAIPYFCVSNPAGGNTVYIGGEAEIT